MPVFRKGSFQLNLGFVQIGGEFDEEDRQCAWELYTELVTRIAVRGKLNEDGKHDFSGEVIAESLDSLYGFFKEARGIMRRYPVGRISKKPREDDKDHLGFFIAKMLEIVVRPFLEKWQATYRHFWTAADQAKPPFARQRDFAHYEPMLADWAEVRAFCRAAAQELAEAYKLVDVIEAVPDDMRAAFLEETRALGRR